MHCGCLGRWSSLQSYYLEFVVEHAVQQRLKLQDEADEIREGRADVDLRTVLANARARVKAFAVDSPEPMTTRAPFTWLAVLTVGMCLVFSLKSHAGPQDLC